MDPQHNVPQVPPVSPSFSPPPSPPQPEQQPTLQPAYQPPQVVQSPQAPQPPREYPLQPPQDYVPPQPAPRFVPGVRSFPTPQEAVPFSQQPPQNLYTQPPQKKHHYFRSFIIIVILLLLGGGGASAAYLGFFNSPDSNIKRSFVSLEEAQTFHSKFVLSLSGYGTQPMVAEIEGDIDRTLSTSPKIDQKITFSGIGMKIGADFKYLDEAFYIRIGNVPLYAAMMPDYFNKWYSITFKELEELQKLTGEYGSYNVDSIKKQQEMFDVSAFYDMLSKYHVLKDVSLKGVSKSGTEYVRTYGFTIDKEALGDAVIEILLKDITTTPSPIDDLRETVDEFLTSINFDPFTVTMGILDGKIRHISGGINYTGMGGSSADMQPIKLTMDITYSDFNKPMNIVAPASSAPLMDIINESLSSARAKGADAAIKAHLANSRAFAEVYYDSHKNSYLGFCKKDSNTLVIIDTLTKNGGEPKCFDTAKTYALSAKLSDSSYYCADSSGIMTSIVKPITKTSCK